MTAKLELKKSYHLHDKWADRLTSHEAEKVLSEMKQISSVYDADHGQGDFTSNAPLCSKTCVSSSMKVLTHRGVPHEKRESD